MRGPQYMGKPTVKSKAAGCRPFPSVNPATQLHALGYKKCPKDAPRSKFPSRSLELAPDLGENRSVVEGGSGHQTRRSGVSQ